MHGAAVLHALLRYTGVGVTDPVVVPRGQPDGPGHALDLVASMRARVRVRR